MPPKTAHPAASPWWTPDVHADRRGFLMARGRIQAALRGFFAERDFVELLAHHGLAATRVHPNFGHNQARMTFSAKR